MYVTLILLVLAFLFLSLYNIYVLSAFGVPATLSQTYYFMEEQHPHRGLLFPLLLIVLCATILPAWLHVSTALGTVVSHFDVLIYLTAISILCVALLSRYQKSRTRTYLHYGIAIVAECAAVLWILYVCFCVHHFAVAPFIVFFLFCLAAVFTKTFKTCTLYWLELAGIYALVVFLFLLSI